MPYFENLFTTDIFKVNTVLFINLVLLKKVV